MITSGRRAKRPDGAVYRQMRRQTVGRRTLLERVRAAGGGGRRSLLQRAAGSLRFLATLFR